MIIAICDDDAMDREIVSDLLHLYFSQKSITYRLLEYENGTSLLQDIEDGSVCDLAFLDIFLDDQLGIDVARKMRRMSYKGDIVFSTAFADFAVDSYDVYASGYLLKPYSFEKLRSVMDRVSEKFAISTYDVRRRTAITRIPYNDILYVESNNNKCVIHCVDDQEYVVYKRLDVIEKELNDPRFLRCHQSYLVNMNYIQCAENQFKLFNGDTIMIRRKSLKEIREKYLRYVDQRGKAQ